MKIFLPRPYSPPQSDSQDYLESSEHDGEDEWVSHLIVQQKGAEKEKIVILTVYGKLLPQIKHFRAEHDHQANNIWTECEQERAEKGNRGNDVDDLQSQLRGHYKEQMKISNDAYICIPMDAIPKYIFHKFPMADFSLVRSSLVDIRNYDETPMAFICMSLPAKIQNYLTNNLLAVFGTPDLLTEKNTRVDVDSTFQLLYLSWYNRHCTKVIPYISKDIKDNQKMFQSLKAIFKELFNWIHGIASGSQYFLTGISLIQRLTVKARTRSFAWFSPLEHSGGMVPMMVETGLVIELNHGDFAIFRLSDITHLNLYYAILRGIVRSYSYSNQNACPKLCGLVNFDGRQKNTKGKSKVNASKGQNNAVTLTMNARVQSTQAAQKEAMEAKYIEYTHLPQQRERKQLVNSDEEDFQGVLTRKPRIGEDGSSNDYDEDEGARPDDVDQLILDDQDVFYLYLCFYTCSSLVTAKDGEKAWDHPQYISQLSSGSCYHWACCHETAYCQEDIQAKLLEVNSNEEIKNTSIDYVWGKIVAKAHFMINGAYHIPGDMTPAQIKEVVTWLLETGAFADGDLDIKARMFNKQKSFSHQTFKDLIHNQLPQLAYMNGNKATIEFSENVFKIRWEYYFKKLSVLQRKSPIWTKKMRDGLYQDILNLANLHYLGIDDDYMKDEDFGIDFKALEGTVTVVEHTA
ncbi:hypothetical protein SERLADRAFT_405864 [Serpula lacrymans var. lacrymans S7.9]|uniref:Uncharacterized protein n=1 Tax=Serpula lacrymans var. lacrymans (strain S7.9) TaxID=578457 RepID=F8NJM2_SERL9|nr:uncharacterized protein SERLADRAFT_405864 [Serpula lacrymans var. lacrymans S7.9]EGO28237.1 hypothetical protein SERLADRAFT_405864 [Serpula lacrymans var. lacrymans S7.9]